MQSLREAIADAEAQGYAIGHFNFSTIEVLHTIVEAARSLDTPIIIGTSEGERGFVGLRQAVALIRSLREQYNHPIFLNADHTYSVQGVKEAIDTGYDSVIFDGAELSFEENVSLTKQCVEYARSVNPEILVEGELGYIGKSSKLRSEVPEKVLQAGKTTPEEARDFVKKTGIDALAPSVGNLHGIVKGAGNPDIDASRISAIREAVGVPLVLHGGSGIRDEEFQTAIKAGVSVVHINTEIRRAWRDATERSLAEDKEQIAPYKILKPAQEAVKEVVERRLKLFSNA